MKVGIADEVVDDGRAGLEGDTGRLEAVVADDGSVVC